MKMCGRFTLVVTYEELLEILDKNYEIKSFESKHELPRYNIAPTQDVISIIHDGEKYRAGYLKWGLVPSFAKDEKIGLKMINAKAETLLEKPSFAKLIETKRCVILADSFYEWKKDEHIKTPYRISILDQKVFPLAGLRSVYQREDGSKLHTVTIITTEANQFMKEIHERMPVILTKESEKIWLNLNNQNIQQILSCLKPYDDHLMQSYQVSSYVNSSLHEDENCIKRV
jgi:putative SOS response-associated peptidase YedK